MRQHVAAWSPPKASIQITGGGQHLRDAEPPEDWAPPAPVGFAPPEPAHDPEPAEPLIWEGDGA